MNNELDIEIADHLADPVDGPRYEWDEAVANAVVRHEPSPRDLVAQFTTRLRSLAAGVEGIGGQRWARYLCVDNKNYKRRYQYALLRIPHEDIVSRASDTVRHAYFSAMDKFAERVAEQVAIARGELGAPWSVRWCGAAPMSNIGGDDGRRRIAIDGGRDGVVVLLAGYYYVCPMERT